MNPRLILLFRFFPLVGLIVAWQIVSSFTHDIILPKPVSVLTQLIKIVQLEEIYILLPEYTMITLNEILIAFTFAAGLGLPLGFTLGMWRKAREIYEPMLSSFYSIPNVIWYPLLMLYLGLGPESKVAYGFILGFFPIVFATIASVAQVDRTLIVVAASFGAKARDIFFKVVLPSSIATIVSGLRVGLALTIIGVVVAEMLGTRAGLGFLMDRAYSLLRTSEYLALVILVVVIALLLNGVSSLVERMARR